MQRDGLRGTRRKGYAADDVFDALAVQILRGELAPDAPLPPERELSDRFDVSKVLVRQAMHRLAEAGLVRVRQGDVTRVAHDPSRACDLRVIELYYRMAPSSRGAVDLTAHVLEKQYTQGLSLVDTFARRASPKQREQLLAFVVAAADGADTRTENRLALLEQNVWSFIARAGGNRILEAEVAWWYDVLPSRPTHPSPAPLSARFEFYVALAKLLADERADAVAFYRQTLAPSITALFREPDVSHASHDSHSTGATP